MAGCGPSVQSMIESNNLVELIPGVVAVRMCQFLTVCYQELNGIQIIRVSSNYILIYSVTRQ